MPAAQNNKLSERPNRMNKPWPSLSSLMLSKASAIWLLLMLCSGLLWWLGFDHGAVQAIPYGVAALIAIAFLKIRFVVMDFMQVNKAPRLLHLILDGWIFGVGATLILIHWFHLPVA